MVGLTNGVSQMNSQGLNKLSSTEREAQQDRCTLKGMNAQIGKREPDVRLVNKVVIQHLTARERDRSEVSKRHFPATHAELRDLFEEA